MAKTNDKFARKQKPVILLVLEGKNKTERNYFTHFKERNAPYILKIVDCESTDINSMVKKALEQIKKNQLNKDLGDRIFVVCDLDLDRSKDEKLTALKNARSFKDIEFIISNPCFEVWFMYYFTNAPKQLISSQKVKEEMKKYIPNYSEDFDTYTHIENVADKHSIAIVRSINRNKQYTDNSSLVDKNPYTQVHELVQLLLYYPNNRQ